MIAIVGDEAKFTKRLTKMRNDWEKKQENKPTGKLAKSFGKLF